MNSEICYSTITGSNAYGLNHKDSDIDYIHVYISSPNIILNLSDKEKIDHLIENEKDNTSYDLKKYLQLLCSNNPTILETLFVDQSLIQKISNEFKLIYDIKYDFLTSRIANTYGGYAIQQLKRINNRNKWIQKPPLCYSMLNELDMNKINNLYMEIMFSTWKRNNWI